MWLRLQLRGGQTSVTSSYINKIWRVYRGPDLMDLQGHISLASMRFLEGLAGILLRGTGRLTPIGPIGFEPEGADYLVAWLDSSG